MVGIIVSVFVQISPVMRSVAY